MPGVQNIKAASSARAGTAAAKAPGLAARASQAAAPAPIRGEGPVAVLDRLSLSSSSPADNGVLLIRRQNLQELIGREISSKNPAYGSLDYFIPGESDYAGAALVLSKDGKDLLSKAGLDQGKSLTVPALPAEFSLQKHVDQILMTPEAYDELSRGIKNDAGGLAEAPAGSALAPIASKFVLRSDPMADLMSASLTRTVPAFSRFPAAARKPVAALVGQVADFSVAGQVYPINVPWSLKAEVALSRTTSQPVHWPIHVSGPNVKEFCHGAESKTLIHGGTLFDVPTFFHGLSQETQDKINVQAQKYLGRKIEFREVYGPGLYTGNATIAASYAHGKLTHFDAASDVQKSGKIYIFNGKIDVGQETTEDLDEAQKKNSAIHTRLVPDAEEVGPYRVTRGGQYIQPTGMTTFDPFASGADTIKGLVKIAKYDRDFATKELGALDRSSVRQGLEALAEKGEGEISANAKALLAALPAEPGLGERLLGSAGQFLKAALHG